MGKKNFYQTTNIGFITYVIFQTVWVFATSLPVLLANLISNFFLKKEKNITGQTVLITGSARGLGKALALEFAKNGCKIICVDINESLNEKTVEEINEKFQNSNTAVGYRCDVSHLNDIKTLCSKVYNKYEQIDILVNNAGIVYGKPLPNEQEEMVQKVLNVNFMSYYWFVHTFLPKMKEQKKGHLVFINSLSSLIPLGDATMYTSTKYGLLGLTDALLDEFSRNSLMSNIKISSVHPFFVNTEGLNGMKISPKFITIKTQLAARLIVDGIKKEYVKFTVPGNEFVYWCLSLSKVIPVSVYQRIINKIYKKVMS